jgi:AcrR family transcriptional regulator
MSQDTRQRILTKAHDLFYKVGFHGVGLDRIVDEVGVTKTTFYNHFESKDELVLEVLRFHDRWWRDTFRDMLRAHGGDTAHGQLLAVFDALEQTLACEGYNGCFFINVAVQFPLPHDPAHVMAAGHKQAMEAVIREVAGYAGAKDAAGLAEELALVMEGAYVTRQVTGNTRTAAIARRIGLAIVEKYLGASPPMANAPRRGRA